MDKQTETPKELQDWADSLSPEQLTLMIAILQSQMFTLDRITRWVQSNKRTWPMNQTQKPTYQQEDIEILKQYMSQMTTDELVSFMTEVCRIADEEKKAGTHF